MDREDKKTEVEELKHQISELKSEISTMKTVLNEVLTRLCGLTKSLSYEGEKYIMKDFFS